MALTKVLKLEGVDDQRKGLCRIRVCGSQQHYKIKALDFKFPVIRGESPRYQSNKRESPPHFSSASTSAEDGFLQFLSLIVSEFSGIPTHATPSRITTLWRSWLGGWMTQVNKSWEMLDFNSVNCAEDFGVEAQHYFKEFIWKIAQPFISLKVGSKCGGSPQVLQAH